MSVDFDGGRVKQEGPQYQGTIKSFNPSKGWGFIECAQTQQIYGKDIFLLKTSLPENANKGDPVTFSIKHGASGPEATRVALRTGAGDGGWVGPPESHGRCSRSVVSRHRGVIKSFNPAKGWGMIASDEMQQTYGKDIFFMTSSVVTGESAPGEQVTFVVIQGIKGPEASDIQTVTRGRAQPAYLGVVKAIGMPVSPRAPPVTIGLSSKKQTYYGTVKSFSEEKGWGHISCDAAFKLYNKDVFVMRSSLQGVEAEPGLMVSFKIDVREKGPQAFDVEVVPQGYVGEEEGTDSLLTGTIKSFNKEKGWGFVTSEEIQATFGKDIFLHRKEIGDADPSVGDVVQFIVDIGNTGQLEATQVTFGGYQPIRRVGRTVGHSSPF